jgi:signal transduction histidine kinase
VRHVEAPAIDLCQLTAGPHRGPPFFDHADRIIAAMHSRNASPRDHAPSRDGAASAAPAAAHAADQPRILRIGTPADSHASEPRWVSPRGIIDSIVAEVRDRHDRREHRLPAPRIEIDVPAGHAVHADPAALRSIFEILLDNAFDAASQAAIARGVPPVREVVVTSVDSIDAIEIEVADSGPAVDAGARLFVPDGGTTPDGSGRGPAFAKALIERLGGTLHAINCPEGGTAYTLRLPHRRARRAAA